MLQMQMIIVLMLITASAGARAAFGFQLPLETPIWRNRCLNATPKLTTSRIRSHLRYTTCRQVSSKLDMVRNIDLPEALVFYGVESIMEPRQENNGAISAGDSISCTLRPGVARLLSECKEVGTAALLLSEEVDKEEGVKLMFQKACEQASDTVGNGVMELVESDDPVLHFRCLNSNLVMPVSTDANDETLDTDSSDEYDDSIEFYNLQANGRSPSPAFLLDSLLSVNIDPRGFGGSSGFGRGQWIEPRRSPMPARAVVFIAGDWTFSESNDHSIDGEKTLSTVKDRCAAARAAGCRIIYLEDLSEQPQQTFAIEDDTQTMGLCDAVIDTFGNDNPRDLQPISLDAVSTPGDYWLNPPLSRDDVGNRVSADDIVDWFRSEREMEDVVGDKECVVLDEGLEEDEMSEEELNKILADLDGL